MPDNNLLPSTGNPGLLLMTVALLSFATASYAQKAGDLKSTVLDTIPGATEPAGVHDLIEKDMYNSLVDSVNRRKLLPQGLSANRSRFDTLALLTRVRDLGRMMQI
jgi:hypothetical protein